MTGDHPLSALVAPRIGEEPSGALEDLVAELHAAARDAWPAVELSGPEFARYLADRLPDGADREALRRVASVDLYLACACLRGDPRALELFDRMLTAEVEAGLRRLRATPSEVADLGQTLRERLLLAGDGERARLIDFSGRGDLRSWLRVSAVRTAMSGLRAQKRDAARRDEMAAVLPGSTADPELDFIRERYRADFKAAFEAALRHLPGRDRTLLRMSFLDDASIDEIGRIFRVHRATAARWLAAARQGLLDDTRQRLMERLGADSGEVESLIRLLDSQMNVSVRRYLAATGTDVVAPGRGDP